MKVTSDSDIGLCRSENQDTVICEWIGESVLIAVCDGMGGENSGLDASNLASEVIKNKFLSGYSKTFSSVSVKELLISAVSAANTVIYNTAHAEPDKSGMGSTCVAAFVDSVSNIAHIVNVGDSRAYLCSDTSIKQVTVDHSYVQFLIDQGKITEEEKEDHPRKNMLIRAVGVEKDVDIDYFEVELLDKKLLLCSDGLHGCCSNQEILDVVNSAPLEDAAKSLINLALEKGGPDNVTIAVAENC